MPTLSPACKHPCSEPPVAGCPHCNIRQHHDWCRDRKTKVWFSGGKVDDVPASAESKAELAKRYPRLNDHCPHEGEKLEGQGCGGRVHICKLDGAKYARLDPCSGADRCCQTCPHHPKAHPVIGLDSGGIGDALCVMGVANSAGMPYSPPEVHRDWISLFVEPSSALATIPLKLATYRIDIDQCVTPRWKFWGAQAGAGFSIPSLRELSAEDLAVGRRYAGRLVLAPFAGHTMTNGRLNRTWPLERWLEVNRLLVESGYRTLILDRDPQQCKPFHAGVMNNEPGVRFTDRCDIFANRKPSQVAAVLRNACGFVGNDSGMAHLAGMIGVPGVAVCAACSDVDIFKCYPSIEQIGERGCDFLDIEPATVVERMKAQIGKHDRDWFDEFAKIILTRDQWRAESWLEVYRQIRKVVGLIKPRRVVEIGCRAGYSSWLMLHSGAGRVDSYDANVGVHGGFVDASEHARKILPPDRWSLTIADSHTLGSLPEADMVYIDGDHTESGCYQDLRLALTARPEWIVVDDVTNCHDSVPAACDRFAKEIGVAPEFYPSQTGLYVFRLNTVGPLSKQS